MVLEQELHLLHDKVFMKGVQLGKIIVLCALSAVCNAALSHFVINVARLPLYQDTFLP